MLSMETPLHESPAHGAPVIALLPEGTVVSIDGPPVDGFYPVTAGDLSGWMRGETLSLEKDVVAEGGEASPPPEESDGLVPVEQTAGDDTAPVETSATVDPAADPALAAEPPAETVTDPAGTEPVADVAYDDAEAPPADPAALPADPAVNPDLRRTRRRSSPAAATRPLRPTPPRSNRRSRRLAPQRRSPVAPATETPADAAAEPAPDASPTPSPTPEPEPVGPASVTVDAPIRTGPGPSFDLIFTVPMGSTVQQTGHVTDGYVTVQYKEVTGWLALEHLGAPSSFVAETPPAETAAPVETAPVEPVPPRRSRSRPSRSRSRRRALAQASPSRPST